MSRAPLLALAEIPVARGSHTSRKAAERVSLARRATKTAQYCDLLAARGPTIDEDAARLIGCKHSSVCSIRWNLLHGSTFPRIRKAGEQIAASSGESCTAWELTP